MKKATAKNYEAICHEIGFNPDVHFVKITTAGTISFTAGKREEVRALLKAVVDCGYKPAKALVEAAR